MGLTDWVRRGSGFQSGWFFLQLCPAFLIEVFRQDAEAVLRVTDTGVGIPLSAQSRVFERFFRVDEARDRAHGGTGLGLSIVKHVVDLHGGRIALTSELGEGSIFTVSLPIGGENG